MIIFDTDHVSVLRYPEHSNYATLAANMEQSAEQDFAVTAVSLEEQMRGWLAAIHRTRDVHHQILYYNRLIDLVEFFSRWLILTFDEAAADRFLLLRDSKIRVGTMDLKIAAIALCRNALLLSSNSRDFEKVPGLQVEDWIH